MTKDELPELTAAMMRIVERLEALEKKMDLVLSQTAHRFIEGREHPKSASLPVVSSQTSGQSRPSERPNEARPVQGPAQGQVRGRAPERREKILHKAVCADCHKDCEVPFNPTGERPVYCKECFSKRKGGNSLKGNHGNEQASGLPSAAGPVNLLQRQVVVTKKGVGKVTVSEFVRSPVRDVTQKQKSHKPGKKSKR